MIKKSGLILSLILIFTVFIKADVPPPKGYVRVSVNFVAETKEDLSDYRFFFDFYGNFHEVNIQNKAKTIVPPSGGGARYASGKFLAVPKSAVNDSIGGQPYGVSELFKEKKVEGIIELGEHSFTKTVLRKDGKKVQPPVYLIERKADSLIMTQKKAVVKRAGLEESEPKSGKTMIAGIFLSLSAIFGGVFIFRKKTVKN